MTEQTSGMKRSAVSVDTNKDQDISRQNWHRHDNRF